MTGAGLEPQRLADDRASVAIVQQAEAPEPVALDVPACLYAGRGVALRPLIEADHRGASGHPQVVNCLMPSEVGAGLPAGCGA
jgi:hypothetical protein